MNTILVLALLVCVGLTVSAPQNNDFLCDGCVSLSTVLKKYVQEELPLKDLEEELTAFCQALSGQLRDFCEKELIPLVDQIYDELSDTTPREDCEFLGFCEKK
ncbi:uncharacterized protein LOC114329034 [Diabrotica virgifera virgifera]|uniref:Saposin B-type domain-containing protein n=1 Tax=Diabrotica virgifera virgifera TaxID=50390 RepID=A0ABM5IIW6_DIAVI|nr:uncharacterized protein LOC114329034 [Diabrotica virgifera virgifera]